MDDQNKTFRTRLVAFWMLTNAGLAVAIENINGLFNAQDAVQDENELRTKQNIYFAVILYSTFGLAAVRFTGVSCSPSWGSYVLTRSSSVCGIGSNVTFSDAAGGIRALDTSYRYALLFRMDSDQISSYLPSLITSVCIPYPQDIRFYTTRHDHHRPPYIPVVSLSAPKSE